jgi:hypothetical protein
MEDYEVPGDPPKGEEGESLLNRIKDNVKWLSKRPINAASIGFGLASGITSTSLAVKRLKDDQKENLQRKLNKVLTPKEIDRYLLERKKLKKQLKKEGKSMHEVNEALFNKYGFSEKDTDEDEKTTNIVTRVPSVPAVLYGYKEDKDKIIKAIKKLGTTNTAALAEETGLPKNRVSAVMKDRIARLNSYAALGTGLAGTGLATGVTGGLLHLMNKATDDITSDIADNGLSNSVNTVDELGNTLGVAVPLFIGATGTIGSLANAYATRQKTRSELAKLDNKDVPLFRTYYFGSEKNDMKNNNKLDKLKEKITKAKKELAISKLKNKKYKQFSGNDKLSSSYDKNKGAIGAILSGASNGYFYAGLPIGAVIGGISHLVNDTTVPEFVGESLTASAVPGIIGAVVGGKMAYNKYKNKKDTLDTLQTISDDIVPLI